MGVLLTKCPGCGASLSLTDDREVYFCQYCGAKINLTEKTEHTTIIRDEAEILRAKTEAKRQDLELRKYNSQVKRKKIRFIAKIVLPLLLILALFLLIYKPQKPLTNYPVVSSNSYTEKAFNITPEQVLSQLLKSDKHLTEYNIQHSEWIISNNERVITEQQRQTYHDEQEWKVRFYIENESDNSVIEDDEDYRVICVITLWKDNNDHIIYSDMTIPYSKTYTEKKLKGYLTVSFRNLYFSIINGQNEQFVHDIFEKSSSETDGDVEYRFDSLHFLSHAKYQMYFKAPKK